MEKREKEKRQLSIPRSSKYLRMSIPNEEEREGGFASSRKAKMSESMFNPGEDPVQKKKKKMGVMIDIKQLRGTANMPQLDDFAPKRSEIIPLSPPRRSLSPQRSYSPLKSHIDMANSLFVRGTEKKQFRRQKYIR